MKQAFTLIELLVVVLIIGILSAIALPQYQKAVEKARYSQLMVLVRAAADAQELYYLTNNTYATTFEDLDIQMPTSNTTDSNGYITIAGKGVFFITSTSIGGWSVGVLQPRFFCQYQHTEDVNAGKCGCYGWSEKEVNMCQALGGVLQDVYNSQQLDKNLYLF